MISLLQREYSPLSGKILLDGHAVEQYELSSLRAQFSVVSEDISLVNDTLAHNIAYGRLSEVSKDAIIAVSKRANLWPLTKELPNGLNTKIGENGVLLSAGQRQRVAIARAMLKNAPILILDEATSGLDIQNEKEIHVALSGLMKNRTTIIIAHRLSTIEHVDNIFVFNEGRIVEQGQHQFLIKQQGYYAKLYECLRFESKVV